MIFRLSPELVPYFGRAVCMALDEGQGAARLELYDSVERTRLLATLQFAHPVDAAVDATGVRFRNFVQDENASGRGRARWARAVSASGVVVFECDVGNEASDAVIRLDEPTIYRGDEVMLDDLQLRLKV